MAIPSGSTASALITRAFELCWDRLPDTHLQGGEGEMGTAGSTYAVQGWRKGWKWERDVCACCAETQPHAKSFQFCSRDKWFATGLCK